MALQFIVKGLILFCILQHWVDSAFKTFGLPSRASRRHFKKTDERVYREHANIREDSVRQREKLHRYSSRGNSQRLAELFKLENNDYENVPNSFQPLQRKHHTSSSTRKSEYSTMTAVHTSRENVNKDYVFRDIVHNDGLNSYAVAPAPTEYEGTNWYITAVSAVLVLLVVAALCVYAPCGCLWKRPRSEVDVNCPITTSEKGMCGNCYLHRNATTNTKTYEERPHHVSVTMASNVRHHRPSSGDYSSQYTWAHGTQRPGKLNQAKSKISNLFKGSHESHLYGEPVAYRASGTYGSTKDTEGKFVDRYGRRSRDSIDADEVVEYALKLRPGDVRNYDDSEELFDVRRPRKSSLKLGISRRRKANAKIVHFFPSNFSYDAQFVQIPPKGKMAETPVGDFEKRFNLSYREPRSDLKAVQLRLAMNQALTRLRLIVMNRQDYQRIPGMRFLLIVARNTL
ncbi:hypothetical protein OS493_016611 [Desmophyllum pertusum]|uniref:Uncharacterized protein n=1 Tax=Desmophyllum pertusum TaxID=174260 RepID=A0A9W9ZG07_9CNID|nr:hypothetical protein OS493_016611 [Desmophyllum pertusum]